MDDKLYMLAEGKKGDRVNFLFVPRVYSPLSYRGIQIRITTPEIAPGTCFDTLKEAQDAIDAFWKKWGERKKEER